MVLEVKVVVCIVMSGRNCQISLLVRNSRGEVDRFRKHLTGNTFSFSSELVHALAQGDMTSFGVSGRLYTAFILFHFNATTTLLKQKEKNTNILATTQSTL